MTEAQQKKVTDNMGLVNKVIREKVHSPYNVGMFSYDDLYQIGCIGLCKAATTDKGGTFSTYAYRLIWNEICDALIKATRISKREQLREPDEVYRAVKENEPLELFLACELQILMDQLRSRASGTTAKGILCMELSSEGYTSSEIAGLVGA